MRLLAIFLAVGCVFVGFGKQIRPSFAPSPSKVCSIPLLEVPHSNPNKRFNRFAVPSPPHPDHLQVAPPAPPCHMDQNFFRPRGPAPKPLPPLPRKP